MRYCVILFCLVACLAEAQTQIVAPGASIAATSENSILSGKWTYRSFHNEPAPVNDDANKALALIFAEAVFTFEVLTPNTLKGAIDWPGGGLDLQGTIQLDNAGVPTIEAIGSGRPGTGTASWEYDYYGSIARQWPNAIKQVPAIVGSVIRAKPHDGAPAGYVASFIAVKQP
jgi:hypothetical protein